MYKTRNYYLVLWIPDSGGNTWYSFTFIGAVILCGKCYLAGNEIRIFFFWHYNPI